MLHEILVALWYNPSEVFIDFNADLWLSKPELTDFIHPGDMDFLRKITNIVAEYYKIEVFLENVGNKRPLVLPNESLNPDFTVASIESDDKEDIYLVAMCQGINEALQSYKDEICKLEEMFLSNTQLSLCYISRLLAKYANLFITINGMLQSIIVEQVNGTMLFGRFDKYCNCGVLSTEKAAKKIVLAINSVFYTELATWLIFGKTIGHSNFFIYDCQCNDTDFLYPWENDESINSSSSPTHLKKMVEKLHKSYRVKKFVIKTKLLPTVIPYSLAETILFIGRIVWILQNNPRKIKSVLNAYQTNDLFEGKALEFSNNFFDLRNESFEEAQLESKIVQYQAILTKYLWNVMVNEANLLEHLQLIRDYYCLGRGELFQEFIVVAEEQRKNVKENFLARYLNNIFTKVAGSMYGAGETSYTKFELMLPYYMDPKKCMENPLDYLEMYFDVEWPLHIVFHPKVFTMLNKLFSFLLRVKKTQICLHRVWLKQHSAKQQIGNNMWFLRHTFIHLINNFQYYLQVDVIETEFDILRDAIKNANEYSDIVRLHSIFVANLLSKSFVMCIDEGNEDHKNFSLYQDPNLDLNVKNKIYNVIMCLLELCDSFCLLVGKWEEMFIERSEEDIFTKCKGNLDIILEKLYQNLNSLYEKTNGEHFMQLLKRLDHKLWQSAKPTNGKANSNITQSR